MKTIAMVQVTIDVTLTQPWANDCPVSQVWEQAGRSAEGAVRQQIGTNTNMRVVAVKTTCVMTEGESDG